MASGGSAARQLEEIEAALSVPRSASPFDPCICPLSAAYATLFDLMRRVSSAADLPEEHLGLHSLSLHCRSLILTMISGVASPDEETAALALKCLRFMFYHPAISSGIPGSVAGQVVEALAKLVLNTQMKAICNLGVWCISVQQLDTSILVSHFNFLLRAIVHASDNPFGSSSTTLEAMQATVKLATQLHEKMRDTSEIWAPAIYRRLLSVDKKEREVSERCLMKVQFVLLPPSLTLSKVLPYSLSQWLSFCSFLHAELQHEQILFQFHLCWKQFLGCLLRSQPPILFDSSFLEDQASLLRAALDNRYAPISRSTLEFWKATYGTQNNLCYPQILLPIMDKLLRSGLIEPKDTRAFLRGCCSSVDKAIEVPQATRKSMENVGLAEPTLWRTTNLLVIH